MRAQTKADAEALLSQAAGQATTEQGQQASVEAQADLPDLKVLSTLPAPLAAAVLQIQANRGNATYLAAVNDGPKALVKEAKRAVYRLRSAGVQVPEQPSPRSAAPSHPEAPPEEFPCLVSSVTGTGERALMLVRAQRGGGVETQHCLFDDTGVIEVTGGELNRNQLRRLLREAFSQKPQTSMTVALTAAKELLAEAAHRSLESRRAYPPGLEELLRRFDIQPKPRPMAFERPSDADEREGSRSHLLHEEPEIAAWLPPEAELRLLAQRLDEVTTSPLDLTPAQRQSQVDQRIRSSAESFFTVPLRALYARRLEDMASYFDAGGRTEPAALARATARCLAHESSALPRFALELFAKVVRLSDQLRKSSPQPAPEPSPRAGDPHERRSSGGIILP